MTHTITPSAPSTVEEAIDLMICPDCALWAANHDDSGSTPEWCAWRDGEGAAALAPMVVLIGEPHEFIPRPCEAGCPNTLAGARFEAVAYPSRA